MHRENTLTKAVRAALPYLAVVATVSVFNGIVSSAYAQEAEATLDDNVEKVIVTGSRGAPRSVADSAVPVDILSADDLKGVAFNDTNDILKTLIPSYSINRQPISDGSSFIRPAQMRGLPTDKTLVLVNSKRRHRAALVEIGGSGTQGPDVATIPIAALKTVEVLRDGAAAQYGSDAIAGVINFHLKDNSEGGSFSVDAGQYYEGDGTQFTLSGNMGFAVGEDGFLSISAEYSDVDFTSRSEQYCESWFCLDPSNPVYSATAGYNTYLNDPNFMAGVPSASLAGDVVQPWGQPNSEALRLFFNAGLAISSTLHFYGFGNYSASEADGGFFYRYPGNGTIENIRLEDGSVWNPLAIFPGGFTPRFTGEVTDYSLASGIKGEFDSEFQYDISARLGHNEIQYTLANTINPSMGPASPTSFKPGDLINEEFQLQADFVKYIDLDFDTPLVVGFGLSYMDESYELIEGDPDSYLAGPHALSDPYGFCDGTIATDAGLAVIASGSSLDCANSADPVYRVVGVGSNGFPGYSPEFTEKYDRDSKAAYVDLSTDVTETLFLHGALRYEKYSDFDSELVWKVATQVDLTETVGLRASVGTGFRAPTPGQQGTTNVSTRLPNGFPVATGLFPAGGIVAQALGAEALRPETSTNYTLGITASFDSVSVTLDYYRIKLEDRVNAISTLNVSTDITAGAAYDNYLALSNAGVIGAESIGGVFYFQNAFDTVTEGFDFVVTDTIDSNMGSTVLTASINYNTTEFDSDPSVVFNTEDQFDFVNGTPQWRGVFSAKHDYEDFTILIRANYYGSYENSNGGGTITATQKFDPEVLFDAEISYQISDMLGLSLGARNMFDEYPAKGTIGESCCGRIYRSDSIVDWQGGYYYLRLNSVF